MSDLPLHPQIVHFPVALAVIVPIVAIGIVVAWWQRWLPRRTWLVVVGLQAVLVGGGVAALRTGEADEEVVERVVAEQVIETHEEAAEVFVYAGAGVLVLAAVAALLPRERVALALAAATTVGALAVVVLGYRTGHSGGELVYRHGAAAAFVPETGRAGSPPGHADLDED